MKTSALRGFLFALVIAVMDFIVSYSKSHGLYPSDSVPVQSNGICLAEKSAS